MSHLGELLAPTLPAGVEVPAPLERAWQWMEAQGHATTAGGGYYLTPYAGIRRRGIVFTDQVSLDGLLDEPAAARRLVPLAEIAGDGSVGALWLDDEGGLRFVGLTSEGGAYVLADTAVDLLRLVAVGYAELSAYDLGGPPDERDAVAELRSWVEHTYAVEVPEEWPAVDTADAFAAWVARQRGEAPAAPPVVPGGLPASAVPGEVATILDALGRADGADRLAAVAGVASTGAGLRGAGLEVEVRGGVVATIWVDVAAYPHPERLLSTVPLDADLDQVVTLLGPPERQGGAYVRYVVGGRYLHLEYTPGVGITRVTAMTQAP